MTGSAPRRRTTPVPAAGSAAAPTRSRRGRRPLDSDTREAILVAARRQFAERGFGGATIRGIAGEAGVDSALVMHFFGCKDGLFTAVLQGASALAGRLVTAVAGDPERVGERLARAYLELWDDPGTSTILHTTFRSVASSPEAGRLLRQFLEAGPVSAIATSLDADRPSARVVLAVSQLFGVAAARHVVGAGPLQGLDREEMVALLAPGLQMILGPVVEREDRRSPIEKAG